MSKEQTVKITPDLAGFIGVIGQFSKGRELASMMNYKNPLIIRGFLRSVAESNLLLFF